jgi:hypothetical protein
VSAAGRPHLGLAIPTRRQQHASTAAQHSIRARAIHTCISAFNKHVHMQSTQSPEYTYMRMLTCSYCMNAARIRTCFQANMNTQASFRTFMNTEKLLFIHSCIQTSSLSCIHGYIQASFHTYMHTYKLPVIHSCTHSTQSMYCISITTACIRTVKRWHAMP